MRQRVHLAVLDDLHDFSSIVLPTPWSSFALPSSTPGDRGAGLADLGAVSASEHAERLHVFELEDVGQ